MEMIVIWPKQTEEDRMEEVLMFALENIAVKKMIREPEELEQAIYTDEVV